MFKVFENIVGSLTLFKKINNLNYSTTNNINQTNPNLKLSPWVKKFLKLFDYHDIARGEILDFIEELSMKDLVSDEALSQKLNKEILQKATNLFNVEDDWILGKSEHFYKTLDFYKNPTGFKKFLDTHNISEACLLISTQQFCFQTSSYIPNRHENIFILREKLASKQNRTIYKNYIIRNCHISYWRPKGYLAAALSQMTYKDDSSCHPHIKIVPFDVISDLINQKKLNLTEILRSGSDLGFHHCEDMHLCPYCYINSIDPELNYYGYIQGLKLWLELYDQGFILINYPDHQPKEAFKEVLTYYENLATQPKWKRWWHQKRNKTPNIREYLNMSCMLGHTKFAKKY